MGVAETFEVVVAIVGALIVDETGAETTTIVTLIDCDLGRCVSSNAQIQVFLLF